MFIPSINVKRPDGTSFSVIGRLYKNPMTGRTFHIVQHPEGQAGFFPPEIIKGLQIHTWPNVVNFFAWLKANANG